MAMTDKEQKDLRAYCGKIFIPKYKDEEGRFVSA